MKNFLIAMAISLSFASLLSAEFHYVVTSTQAHNHPIIFMGTSADLLVTVSKDSQVKLWKWANNELIYLTGLSLNPEGSSLTCAAMSKNGYWLAVGFADGKIKLINLRNRNVTNNHSFNIEELTSYQALKSLALNDDGSFLVSWSKNEMFWWDLATRQIRESSTVKSGNLATEAASLAFASDNSLFVSSATGIDFYVHYQGKWKIHPDQIDRHRNYEIAVSSNQLLMVYCWNGSIKFFERSVTNSWPMTQTLNLHGDKRTTQAIFDPRGEMVPLTVSPSCLSYLHYENDTWRLPSSGAYSSNPTLRPGRKFADELGWGRPTTFSADGNILFIATKNLAIEVYAQPGNCSKTLMDFDPVKPKSKGHNTLSKLLRCFLKCCPDEDEDEDESY